jgi:plastocyanin
VTADEVEFSIALSRSSYAAGSYVFVVHNRGTMTHALAISGPGVDASTDDIARGASASLTVTLRAGTYDIFCPIGDHKSLGMEVHVTVS